MNERVFAGQSIETLLAVLMFVLMGITLERSRIADELLTKMANIFGPLPGGLAVSIVVVGAFFSCLNRHCRSNGRDNGLIGSSNDAPK